MLRRPTDWRMLSLLRVRVREGGAPPVAAATARWASSATAPSSRVWEPVVAPTSRFSPGTWRRGAAAAGAAAGGDRAAASLAAPGLLTERIGFIGAGAMGEALIRGFIASGLTSAARVSASVRTVERQRALEDLGINDVFDSAADGGAAGVAAAADVIVLGVKPQALPPVLEALRPHVQPRHLVVSIAAGVTLHTLEAALGPGTRAVRVMPNTPSTVGAGASAYSLGAAATPSDAELVHALLSAVGLAVRVEERLMDAVTGLSGSGPAYVFLAIDALADGGVAAGLPRDIALALAAQTVAGAAAMVLAGGHPAVLKDRVASPAGTTIAGLAELESGGLRGTLIRAVRAAAKRSEELG